MSKDQVAAATPQDSSQGFGIVPRWLRQHVVEGRLSAADVAVYVALTWRLDEDGSTWPSHTTIAAESGTSVSTVQRSLKRLQALGVVDWQHRHREDEGQTSNRYDVAVHRRPKAVMVTDPPGQPDRPPRSQGPTPPVTVTDERDPDERDLDERGGDSLPPSPAREAGSPPEKDRDKHGPLHPQCPHHQGVNDPPPCGRCATWRVEYEAARIKRDHEDMRARSAAAIQADRAHKGRCHTPDVEQVRQQALEAAREGLRARRTASQAVEAGGHRDP